jgi:hypothetical protein
VLIEFTVANFRSVLSPQRLSLVVGTAAELEGRNLIPGEHDGLRLARTAVIYGANAAGKTNVEAVSIIRAHRFSEGSGRCPMRFNKQHLEAECFRGHA